jgi:26S proteasome regulatory subunit N2
LKTHAALIALDSSLRMPKMDFECHVGQLGAARGDFALPDKMEEKGKKKVEKVEKAVLSTANKARDRRAEKDRLAAKESGDAGRDAMDTDAAPGATAAEGDAPDAVATLAGRSKRRQLAAVETLANPARIVPGQEARVVFPAGGRFAPVSARARSGIVMVADSDPDAPVEVVEGGAPRSGTAEEPEEPEPAPPAPFDWADDE